MIYIMNRIKENNRAVKQGGLTMYDQSKQEAREEQLFFVGGLVISFLLVAILIFKA